MSRAPPASGNWTSSSTSVSVTCWCRPSSGGCAAEASMQALTPREGSAPGRDRLLMEVFIADLIHGMLILGLTCSSTPLPNSTARGIDVLLVSDELPTAAHNDTATY